MEWIQNLGSPGWPAWELRERERNLILCLHGGYSYCAARLLGLLEKFLILFGFPGIKMSDSRWKIIFKKDSISLNSDTQDNSRTEGREKFTLVFRFPLKTPDSTLGFLVSELADEKILKIWKKKMNRDM